MPGVVETEPIQYEVDGHVARIWLNRPHKKNSVSQQLLQELDEARIRAEEDDNVRVRVSRGREGTFCFGLVNAWATANELDDPVDRFLAQLVDKSPFQTALTKMCVNRGLDADTETMMLIERLAVGVTLNSNDAAEGVASFLDKREPIWTGT